MRKTAWDPPWVRGWDRRWARDGQPHFTTEEFPNFRKPQMPPKNPEDRVKVQAKIGPVQLREYIENDEVISLAHYFCVPKEDEDICMVYNGTSCGLNDCLYAPHFGLPVIHHTLRSLLPGYHQADMDVGEMFLNFILGEEVRPYSGVDVSHVRLTEDNLKRANGPPDWWSRVESLRKWEHH